MRWLGLRRPDRSERHEGPGGPHPRAKSQREKSTTTSCLRGADLAIHSISSCYFCSARSRHLEFPGQAGGPQQTPYLDCLGDRGSNVCAHCRLGLEGRVAEAGSAGRPVLAGDRCSPCSVYREPSARVQGWGAHSCLSPGTWNRTPAFLLRGDFLSPRASIVTRGSWGNSHHVWHPALLRWP